MSRKASGRLIVFIDLNQGCWNAMVSVSISRYQDITLKCILSCTFLYETLNICPFQNGKIPLRVSFLLILHFKINCL